MRAQGGDETSERADGGSDEASILLQQPLVPGRSGRCEVRSAYDGGERVAGSHKSRIPRSAHHLRRGIAGDRALERRGAELCRVVYVASAISLTRTTLAEAAQGPDLNLR